MTSSQSANTCFRTYGHPFDAPSSDGNLWRVDKGHFGSMAGKGAGKRSVFLFWQELKKVM